MSGYTSSDYEYIKQSFFFLVVAVENKAFVISVN